MLKVGEPDKEGEREYTFSVYVNRTPVIYQVRARHEHDASDRLSRYVEGDAASLQELGAGETGATIVLLGAVAAGAYLVYKHFRLKPKSPSAKQAGKGKIRPPLVNNGTEVAPAESETETSDADGAPDGGFTVQAARPAKAPFTVTATAARSNATAGRTFARRGTFVRGARGVTATSGEIVDVPVTAWRPLSYHGAEGRLAGDDPTKSLKIVVFSDLPADPFLSLVRSSSYDAARARLLDAITVLAFPAAAAATVRSPGAVEVWIGASPTREFDVTAATADEAVSSVRSLLARYL
jgi:hypothetical protein